MRTGERGKGTCSVFCETAENDDKLSNGSCILPGYIERADVRKGRFVGMSDGLLWQSESRRWTRRAEKGGGYF